MWHCVFGNVHDQVFKDPVCLLSIQNSCHLFFRIITFKFQICFFNLFIQFQFHLLKQVHNINICQIQCYIFAACLTDIEQIFNQHFQAHRFSFQHIDILFLFLFVFFIFQKINISNDCCQWRFQIVGHICNEFCLHTLAFYFLFHCFFVAFLNLFNLWFKWIEHTKIFLDFHIHIAFCQFSGYF